MTRILAFSDVHLARNRITQIVAAADEADLVIGAGDFCNARNGLDEAMHLLLPIEDKAVYVPGNAESADELRAATNAPVLHGQSLTIQNLRLFGIGYAIPTIPFGPWSCDLTEEQGAELLAAMQSPTDILISHSPPKGVADTNASGLSLGSTSVREAIEEFQPTYCFCGHIHDCWGETGRIGKTQVFNLGPTANWFDL